MRTLLSATAFAAVVFACHPPTKPKEPLVREVDVSAWTDVPMTELETHQFYSAAPVERRAISDGSELWNFPECAETGKSAKCRGAVVNGVYMSRCDEAERSRVCCTSQFLVADGKVKQARFIGQCQTTCRTRPASKPCDERDARR